MTNGPVRAVTVGRGHVYFGGEFTRVGSYVGSNLRLDWTTGKLRPGFARTNGQVSDIVGDGHGGWYLGGGFDWVEGTRRANLVHIRPDGRVYSGFNAKVNGFVSALALDGDRLYIGGTLKSVDGRDRSGIAVVDAETGRLDTQFRYAGGVPVPELAVSGAQSGGEKRLYAQGYDSFEGPGPVQALDPFSGAVISDFEFPFEARKVGALAVRADTLFVGGGAGHYRGSEFGSAGALVALDGRTGEHKRAFLADSPIAGSVEDIEVDGDRLVVGGDFDEVGSLKTAGVAVLDPATGEPDTRFEAGVKGRVVEIALADGLVHAAVGGDILALDSTGTRAKLDIPAVDGPVDALAAAGGILYAGGRFGLADARKRNGMAAVDLDSGRIDSRFRPSAGPGTHAQLVLAHGRLYVGDYRGVAGPLAAVSPGTGHLLSGFRTPRADPVYDFAVGPDLVYGAVGGESRVLAFDANTGRRARSFRVRTPGYITDLERARGRVYLAGNWDTRRGRRAVVALNARSGALIEGFDPQANGEVQSVAAANGLLYLAGPFDRVGGGSRVGGAAVRLATGSLDGRFRPAGVPRQGVELAASSGRLYARDTRKNRLAVFRAADGGRASKPGWTQFTAVAPTPKGAWFGAAIGSGRKRTTWFLGFQASR